MVEGEVLVMLLNIGRVDGSVQLPHCSTLPGTESACYSCFGAGENGIVPII